MWPVLPSLFPSSFSCIWKRALEFCKLKSYGRIVKQKGKENYQSNWAFDSTLLRRIRWLCKKIRAVWLASNLPKVIRHDANFNLAFAQGFDGKTKKIGDMTIEVTKASIVAATDLPCTSKRWFKNKPVRAIDCNGFLVDAHQEPDWSKRIPRRWVWPIFKDLLMEIQNFITCEGRYGITLLYHMRFLLHFHGDQPLNLPFFLLRSLTKMASRVQHHPTNLANSLFHHGLIKILVKAHLKSRRKTWDRFLYQYDFLTIEPIEIASVQTPATWRRRQLILSGSSGSSSSSLQDSHDPISPPAVEEAMPNSTDHESPVPSEPLPTKEPTCPITQRVGKREHVELNPPEMADPCTPAPCQKRTKRQAKWANRVLTHSVTEPLPPLQETPTSPITISSEEEPVEPKEDIQSPHSSPSMMEGPSKVFPEEYRTPSAEPFSTSDPEPPAQAKEQGIDEEKIWMLREKLAKAEVLERYLKAENVKLRDRVATLREQKKGYQKQRNILL